MIINIGILESKKISVILHGPYKSDAGRTYSGSLEIGSEMVMEPSSEECYFELPEVMIGKQFHWQQNERQAFRGSLAVVRTDDGFAAVNRIDLEEYLVSVISSEMSRNAPLELLKAQCVVARSWAARNIIDKHKREGGTMGEIGEDKRVVWYENSSHKFYDVCADDHCQRYYGFLRSGNPNVEKAVSETRSMVLTYGGEICDARFHKACGGMTERYSVCWDDVDYPYLQPVADGPVSRTIPDLTCEDGMREYLSSDYGSFCDLRSDIRQAAFLNDFDRGIPFYRWIVRISGEELSQLIRQKAGAELGTIENLTPLKRGASGRIYELLIEGSHRSLVVGKELEIRRLLSPSHLYSSAFVSDRDDKGMFTLTGAGWGHGVGMCQVGAAVMAANGAGYDEILRHYYIGSEIRPYKT